jgi:hypothetical protein
MECSMLKWIAAAALAVTMLFSGSSLVGLTVVPSAAAAPAAIQEAHAPQATDAGARRPRHRHLYAYRPYYPYYYGHPNYYSPGPFLLPWFDAWNSW